MESYTGSCQISWNCSNKKQPSHPVLISTKQAYASWQPIVDTPNYHFCGQKGKLAIVSVQISQLSVQW